MKITYTARSLTLGVLLCFGLWSASNLIGVAFATHPLPLLNLHQQNGDLTPLCTGCITTGATVLIGGDSDPATCNGEATYYMEVEVRPVGTPFTGVPTHFSSMAGKPDCVQVAYPPVVVSGLAGGFYKWQARERTTTTGAPGPWGSLAGNGNAFLVDAVGPIWGTLAGGNGNGTVDPNECNTLDVALINGTQQTANNVTATLASVTPGVMITPSVITYSSIASLTTTAVTSLQIGTTSHYICGTPVELTMRVSYAGGPTNTFTFRLEGTQAGAYVLASSSGQTLTPASDLVPDSQGDDFTVPVALPFPVSFYGQSFSSLYASSNGNVQFSSNNGSLSNECLPTAQFSNAIMLYWNDLLTNVQGGDGIYTATTGEAPHRVFHIEWRGVLFENHSVVVNFELRLYEDSSNFAIVYARADDEGHDATVGVQKDTGSQFTQFSCAEHALSEGLMITATYNDQCPAASGTCTVPTTLALVSSQNPANEGQAVTFMATPNEQSTGVPTGQIYFSIDGGGAFPALLNEAGQASLTIASLSPGFHAVQASYQGDGVFVPSSAAVTPTQFINCPPITLTPTTLTNGVQGQPYNQMLTASPASNAYSYAVTTNSLPPGLTLNSVTGAITGTPLAGGNYTFVITATGWGVCTKTQTYNLLISATCSTLEVSPASLPNGVVGTVYSQTLSATGGAAPYSYAVTGGTLPTGLSLSSSGTLTGTPQMSGTFNFAVTATGAGGCTGTHTYSVSVTCPTITFTPASLPNATAGNAYDQTVAASPAGTYSYSIATGSLPPGLTLNAATGALTGVATAMSSYSFSVRAERGTGCSAIKAYTIAVYCPTITVNPASLPGGVVGTTYSQTLGAAPGGSYTYALSGGALPGGLTLSTAGVLAGTPITAGTFNFTVRVTGFGICNGSRSYTVTISAGCVPVTLSDLATTGAVGTAYTGDLSGTTPAGSYTFTLDTGTLPTGLTLDNLFGALLGTPTAPGSFSFILKATSASGCSGTRAYTVMITGGAAALAQFADYDGDGKADLALWSERSGRWDITRSSDAQTLTALWGTAGDLAVSGDYDGDGKTDLALFRPANGTWYIKQSSDGGVQTKVFGLATDVPVPGDYDGDGKTDLAVWRGSNGTWYIERSSDRQFVTIAWGAAAAPYLDVPVPGDYDGDSKTDVAVFRTGNGNWYVKLSRTGGMLSQAWGLGSDLPVVNDYDGDGKCDLAVWRGATGQWFVLKSADQRYQITTWGTSAAGDVPAPGDYDGDGLSDLSVWRATEQRWYVRQSRDASIRTVTQGQSGDKPVPARGR